MKDAALSNLLVDDQAAGIFRVNRRVFTENEYLELERTRLFSRCWIYAGHESEIPKPGDFRSRRVAGRPVILVRGDDGVIRVLLNTCTHRGALVCREQRGNAHTFQCPYHAWTYNCRGDLIGVPGESSYSEMFDRGERALGRPPRVDAYRGFIFVNFDRAAPELNDYLAGAKEYLDLVCDQSETTMRVSEGSQAYSIRANWKLLVENSIDGYHGLPTHQRYFTFLTDTGADMRGGLGGDHQKALNLGNGNAVIEYMAPFGRPIARWVPSFGELSKARIEEKQRRLEERFGPERAFRIGQTGRNLLIFPNLIINDIMAITIRTFFPSAPDYMEVTAWNLGPADETADDNTLRLDNFLTFLGPGGFATPDDVEMLESCQRGFANREVIWSDISRGMRREHPSISDELQIRTFWRRWLELLSTPGLRRARVAA
jgi:p-cumate 2,3-dioxygenase subunit alpha